MIKMVILRCVILAAVSLFLVLYVKVVESYVYTEPAPNVPLTATEKAAFLNAHNYLRYIVATKQLADQPPAADMYYLQWDDDLANRAYSDAQKCQWNHTTFTLPGKFTYVGQNMGVQNTTSAANQVYAWFKEHKYTFTRYLYGPVTMDNYEASGHYTQLVWSNTKFVGCGRYWCKDLFKGNYLIYCNYGIGGNMLGVNPYYNGTACSRCKPDAPLCYNGMCMSAATCAALNVQCSCKVNCNRGTLNPSNCTCSNCPTGLTSYFCDVPCLDKQTFCNYTNFNCPGSQYYPSCPNRCNQTALICTPPISVIKNTNSDNVISVGSAMTTAILPSMPDITNPSSGDVYPVPSTDDYASDFY